MLTVATLNTLLINGPAEVGINAGLDVLGDIKDHLNVNGSANEVVASIRFDEATDDSVKKVVATCAVLLMSDKFSCDRDKDCVHASVPIASGGYAFDGEMTVSDIQLALLIVASSKINWWQMNHHTGRSNTEASGFMSKVLTARLPACKGRANISQIWKACHWWDTRHVLASLGLDIADGVANANWPRVTEDVKLRLDANPAGTALWADSYVVLTAMRPTPAWKLATPTTRAEAATLEIELEYMHSHAAEFHVGAEYLTGKKRKRLTELSEQTVSFVKSCLDVSLKGSTISKSAALMSRTPDTVVTGALSAVQIAIRDWVRKRGDQLTNFDLDSTMDVDPDLVHPAFMLEESAVASKYMRKER